MLSPKDIDEKVFKRTMYGYSVDQVEDFLQDVSASYERLYNENQLAKEKIETLSEAVKKYKAMEETIKNAISVAKSDGEEIKKEARAEAEKIIRNAEDNAADIVSKAMGNINELLYQYEQIKRSVEVFKAKVVSLLNTQLDVIKDYSNIQIDDNILAEAQLVFAKTTEDATAKIESEQTVKNDDEQPTAEIPELKFDENGVYVADK